MKWLTTLNWYLSRAAMYIACGCLAILVAIIVYGVILRYGLDAPPPFVEQIALLLVICVAMFGAAAGVRDAGHIGVDTLVRLFPIQVQRWINAVANLVTMTFGMLLIFGCALMGDQVRDNTIPTLGLSEAVRYAPPVVAGLFIVLFSFEHIVATIKNEKVVPSWN